MIPDGFQCLLDDFNMLWPVVFNVPFIYHVHSIVLNCFENDRNQSLEFCLCSYSLSHLWGGLGSNRDQHVHGKVPRKEGSHRGSIGAL